MGWLVLLSVVSCVKSNPFEELTQFASCGDLFVYASNAEGSAMIEVALESPGTWYQGQPWEYPKDFVFQIPNADAYAAAYTGERIVDNACDDTLPLPDDYRGGSLVSGSAEVVLPDAEHADVTLISAVFEYSDGNQYPISSLSWPGVPLPGASATAVD